MKNIKCEIAYAGTHYFGFQKTKMGPSIEEALEKVLAKVLQHPVKLQAASRTDRGVHAKGQVVNFFTDKGISLEKLTHALRTLLPKDITPNALSLEEETFHPSLDAKGKVYLYQICNTPSQLPFHREFSWHFPFPIDLEVMNLGSKILCGTHDFSAFTTEDYKDPVRTVTSIIATPLVDGRLEIEVTGAKFLYKMVRNLVGTLCYVGCGKIPLSDLEMILASKKRAEAGVTAPAHGLTLKHVFY